MWGSRSASRRRPGAAETGVRWPRPRLRLLLPGLAACLVVAASGARAEQQDAVPPAPEEEEAEAPAVSLERLLQLPDDYGSESEQRAGAGETEWRRRFRVARGRVEGARLDLARTQAELEKVAGSTDAWQMAAPGTTNPENSPVSYKLREEIRRQREEVAQAERRLRDLEVEANLAGVPEAWRSPEP